MPNQMIRKTTYRLALLISVICLTGMFNSSSATTHVVMVSGTALSPDTLTNVYVGDTIKWVYVNDNEGHSMMFTSAPSGTSTFMFSLNAADSVYEYKVPVPGEYEYTCYPHGFFAGYFNAVQPLGIPEFSSTFGFYPNPASGEVIVSTQEPGPVTVRFYTADGRKVKEEIIGLTRSVNIEGLTKGIYIIELAAADQRPGRKRIVIQ